MCQKNIVRLSLTGNKLGVTDAHSWIKTGIGGAYNDYKTLLINVVTESIMYVHYI